jgi:iron(III) transport system substrate-binding protein
MQYSRWTFPGVLALAAYAFLSVGITRADESSNSANWDEIVSAAKQEGKVVLYYTTPGSVIDRIKGDFALVHPEINLESLRIAGAPLLSRVDQEQKSGVDGADVIIYVDEVWVADHAAHGDLKAPIGPNAKGFPERFMMHRVAPVLGIDVFVMAYNPNLVHDPIRSYTDFLRPEFKGKIGSSDLIAASIVAWYQWLEKNQGPDFLSKLAGQHPKLTGGSAATQAVSSGEIVATTAAVPSLITPLASQGAPIKMVVPNPAFGTTEVGMILRTSKRPNAAQVFLDYLMSPRAQTAWSGKGESASVLPNVSGSLDAKTLDIWNPVSYPKNVLDEYTKRWNALFRGDVH